MPTTDGDGVERPYDVVEMMLLLSEEELAHCCHYCGWPEEAYGDEKDWRYKKISGAGYGSTYACPGVSPRLSLAQISKPKIKMAPVLEQAVLGQSTQQTSKTGR